MRMEVAQVATMESDGILNVVACTPIAAVVCSSLSHPWQWAGTEWVSRSVPTQPFCGSLKSEAQALALGPHNLPRTQGSD